MSVRSLVEHSKAVKTDLNHIKSLKDLLLFRSQRFILKSELSPCHHCQLEVHTAYYSEVSTDAVFCCLGCKNVYEILHQQGLESYYELKNTNDSIRPQSPAIYAEKKSTYKHFDQEKFHQDYVRKEAGHSSIVFYLEGVHCLACLWLIETLPHLSTSVKEARLDLGKSIVEITLNQDFILSEIADILTAWGYRPHPVGFSMEGSDLPHLMAKKEERDILKRIGVAAFGAGNIMIYAVSLYGGADGPMASFFGLITLLLALPVLTYSAKPFYQSALGNLRAKTVSIDLPIAIALIIGGSHGAINAFQGNPHNYFDTLTILIFLLLFSRYAVKKMSQNGLDRNLMRSFFHNGVVRKKDPQTETFNEISSEYLNPGDTIKILPGELVRADIVIVSGDSSINKAALTGEPLPEQVTSGSLIPSGSINNEGVLIGEVKQVGRKTKWGETLYKIEKGWAQKSPIIRQMDIIAKRLVIAVLFLSVAILLYFYFNGNPSEGFERALALIIITCPCALGLATPLAMTRGLTQAATKGIIVKSEEIFERLAKIKNLALDKTGTLTSAQIKVTNWPSIEDQEKIISRIKEKINFHSATILEDIIIELEKNSSHPVASALRESAIHSKQKKETQKAILTLKERKEILGEGVQAKIENSLFALKKSRHNEGHELSINIDFKIDQKKIWTFQLEDQIRPDTQDNLKLLSRHGVNIFILSGDRQERVEQICLQLGINKKFGIGELSTDEKLQFIRNYNDIAMVGDGANDALALSGANVGMAVYGSAEVGLRAADIFLSRPGLNLVYQSLILGKQTFSLIKRNIIFSVCYNLIGATAATLGYVSPLWAAIFMPISSLTVLISTMVGTKKVSTKFQKHDTNHHYRKAKS